jgi:hypothetical protein
VFQYLVNGNLRIADPYTDKVADPWNDAQIGEATYPGLIPFTKTEYGIASVLQTAQQPYKWQVKEFKERPKKSWLPMNCSSATLLPPTATSRSSTPSGTSRNWASTPLS